MTIHQEGGEECSMSDLSGVNGVTGFSVSDGKVFFGRMGVEIAKKILDKLQACQEENYISLKHLRRLIILNPSKYRMDGYSSDVSRHTIKDLLHEMAGRYGLTTFHSKPHGEGGSYWIRGLWLFMINLVSEEGEIDTQKIMDSKESICFGSMSENDFLEIKHGIDRYLYRLDRGSYHSKAHAIMRDFRELVLNFPSFADGDVGKEENAIFQNAKTHELIYLNPETSKETWLSGLSVFLQKGYLKDGSRIDYWR